MFPALLVGGVERSIYLQAGLAHAIGEVVFFGIGVAVCDAAFDKVAVSIGKATITYIGTVY
jgi:hypothetical protein